MKDGLSQARALEQKNESEDSFGGLCKPYICNVSFYQPNYFLPATDLEKTKLQFSFKYQFFSENSPISKKHPWLSGFYLGYTQTSFWDLDASSAPFKDTSYKPELFYSTQNFITRVADSYGFFLKSGLLHESNGKSGYESREINTFYIKPILIFCNPQTGYGLSIGPRIWGYLNKSGRNFDIEDYRGFFDVDLKIGKSDGIMLSALLGWAKEGGSIRVDLTYPAGKLLFNDVNFFLHMQYVNTLAENLLDYKERTKALRFGISFIR